MPPKKSKGGKKGSPRSERSSKVERRNYHLISAQELQALSDKRMLQRNELLNILHHIYDAENQWEDYLDEQRDIKEWEFFIRCEGLPKPYLIPDIHLFIEKLQHFELDSVKSTMNWLLAVNELSVLTQDIFQKNTTRDILKQEISPKFGEEYSSYVNSILTLIANIEEFLNDSIVVDSFPSHVVAEIKKEKFKLYGIIRDFFDRYSYRVISSENANCDTIDARTAEYLYEDKSFQIHIWMVKNVPVDFNELDPLSMTADLTSIKLSVLLPFVVLADNLILRGIHYEFDHVSEAARSCTPKIKPPVENITAMLTDLYECLLGEWDLYLTIQDEIRNNMIKKRAEYEEKLLAFEEAEAAAAKAAKAQDGKKPKKTFHHAKPTEQPTVPENMFPEVSEDFYEREVNMLKDFKEANFNPINLRLQPNEINLRQYTILGGVYELYFLHKPKHIDNNFSNYNMTWHENNEHAQVFKEFFIHATRVSALLQDMEDIRRLRSRISRVSKSSHRLSNVLQEPEEQNYDADSQFELKFQLPAMLCDFDVPVVCQFDDSIEEWVDVDVDWISDTNFPQPSKQEHTPRATIESGTIDIMSLRSMASAYFKPGLNAGFVRESMVISTDAVDNFILDFEYAKPEIRALQRHVLPRMLSSYKFPDEVARELKQGEGSAQVKGRSQKKMRKKVASDEDLTLTTHIFTHKNQNNPERLFPIFSHIEPLNIFIPKNVTVWTEEPETFFDLLRMFEILNKYMSYNYRKTLRVPGLKIKRSKLGRQIMAAMVKVAKRRSKDSHAIIEKASIRRSKPNPSRSTTRIVRSPREFISPEPQHVNLKKVIYANWTTQYIIDSNYDKATNIMTVHTNHLGIFGFAFDRYTHFPFKFWRLAANEENLDNEIQLLIETQHVKCIIKISAEGYKAYVTEPTKGFVRFPKKYLVMDEPMADLRLFKKLLREKHLNIFPEPDAGYYIKDDYFCEKHLATELHTYICMAIHCGRIRFEYSIWNRLAQRRDLVLSFVHAKEVSEGYMTVRITPEKTTFVEIKELCSDNLENIKLEFTPTWRNLDHCSDLNQAVNSAYSSANDDRIRDFMLICNVRNLLSDIKLLSFS